MPDPTPATEATLAEILTALESSPVEAANTNAKSAFSCALCTLVRQSVARSLRAFFAEFVNDPQVRETLRKARGFCTEHTEMIGELGDALGAAILYSDLTRMTAERWQKEKPNRGANRLAGLLRNMPNLGHCLGCAAAQEAHARYAGALANGLKDPKIWQALETHDTLCTTHIEMVLLQSAPPHAERLRELEVRRLNALQAELDEAIRKNDYRFRGEVWGVERDAWLRALKKITRS